MPVDKIQLYLKNVCVMNHCILDYIVVINCIFNYMIVYFYFFCTEYIINSIVYTYFQRFNSIFTNHK